MYQSQGDIQDLKYDENVVHNIEHDLTRMKTLKDV